MKREIRDKRTKLFKNAKGLRELQFDAENERGIATHKEENDAWKRYKFYDNMIKIDEKMRKEKVK